MLGFPSMMMPPPCAAGAVFSKPGICVTALLINSPTLLPASEAAVKVAKGYIFLYFWDLLCVCITILYVVPEENMKVNNESKEKAGIPPA